MAHAGSPRSLCHALRSYARARDGSKRRVRPTQSPVEKSDAGHNWNRADVVGSVVVGGVAATFSNPNAVPRDIAQSREATRALISAGAFRIEQDGRRVMAMHWLPCG
jgi:hypothetical protein